MGRMIMLKAKPGNLKPGLPGSRTRQLHCHLDWHVKLKLIGVKQPDSDISCRKYLSAKVRLLRPTTQKIYARLDTKARYCRMHFSTSRKSGHPDSEGKSESCLWSQNSLRAWGHLHSGIYRTPHSATPAQSSMSQGLDYRHRFLNTHRVVTVVIVCLVEVIIRLTWAKPICIRQGLRGQQDYHS